MATDELLAERGKTHGDWMLQSKLTADIKRAMRDTHGSFDVLPDYQREALDMVATKIGRILAGNPNEPDHWDDMAGYSRLVSQRLHKDIASALDHQTDDLL